MSRADIDKLRDGKIVYIPNTLYAVDDPEILLRQSSRAPRMALLCVEQVEALRDWLDELLSGGAIP